MHSEPDRRGDLHRLLVSRWFPVAVPCVELARGATVPSLCPPEYRSMRCVSCGFENPADASFCGECASPLARTLSCPSCGKANPAKQKFCNGCGGPLTGSTDRSASPDPRTYTPKHLAEKILTSRSALEGERKQVTVLFADVKGSMDLAEQVDPEKWHGILDRFFQILSEGVHRFEGTVNQYTGDGIMALFGAPIAHEDHARRACYAALHLRDELRRYADELRRTAALNFSVRMGLNSGEVVVGRIGDDLRMDYTAQGLTVGVAQRMEQLAEAGRAYLPAETVPSGSGQQSATCGRRPANSATGSTNSATSSTSSPSGSSRA
jgi:class 3 adenylate cyclase